MHMYVCMYVRTYVYYMSTITKSYTSGASYRAAYMYMYVCMYVCKYVYYVHYHEVIYLRCLIQGGLYLYVCMYIRTYVCILYVHYHIVIYPRGSYRPCIQGGLYTSYRAAYIPEPQRMQHCHSRRRHLAGEPHSTLATVLPRSQTH
jgi:hypothetical protein